MQVPRLEKIVINMGVGRATQQPSLSRAPSPTLTAISGQKPIVTKAKHSIAGFKLREGQSIGTKVTLRGNRMWEFLDRLIAVAIHASATSAASGQVVGRQRQLHVRSERPDRVPEIDYDKVELPAGMDITIVTTATMSAPAGPARCLRIPFRSGADPLVHGEGSAPVAHSRQVREGDRTWPRRH